MTRAAPSPAGGAPRAITGVQLMQGAGDAEARGFWTEAWAQVLRRPSALAALAWLGVVGFCAAFGPLIANGHPILMRSREAGGEWGPASSPMWRYLSATDLAILLGAVLLPIWLLAPLRSTPRAVRLGAALIGAFQAGLVIVVCASISAYASGRDVPDWLRAAEQSAWFAPLVCAVVGAAFALPAVLVGPFRTSRSNVIAAIAVAIVAGGIAAVKWERPLERYDYFERAALGEIETTYTVVPFGPLQASTSFYSLPPGATVGQALGPEHVTEKDAKRAFLLGTDGRGQDVLSQLIHACRLSISVGLVSTSIAVIIGVTIGALMGYFGGIVDLLLYRVVEIFMAVPLLFLLIVAAAVFPRNTYVMMAIIGCFTWTGAARFTRAEFMKLRGQDFVQSAKAVGLPLRSILFKHMLPNGVTPVLVDASFAIAVAILIEANLSFLGLGPVDQASWGKLLNTATGEAGTFLWWLAIFPGAAIFLTVLSYNLIGEALRDAIDPKLKKARV